MTEPSGVDGLDPVFAPLVEGFADAAALFEASDAGTFTLKWLNDAFHDLGFNVTPEIGTAFSEIFAEEGAARSIAECARSGKHKSFTLVMAPNGKAGRETTIQLMHLQGMDGSLVLATACDNGGTETSPADRGSMTHLSRQTQDASPISMCAIDRNHRCIPIAK